MNWLLVRAVGLPCLFLCGLVALALVRGRVASPQREFLAAFWGSSVLLFIYIVAAGVMLWFSATRAQIARDLPFNGLVGACAVFSLALGLALGWRIRLAGERFLLVVVHPPASLTKPSLRGWALLPAIFLWLALTLGTFSATYGILSAISLAR